MSKPRKKRATKAARIRKLAMEGVTVEDICMQVTTDERYVREVARLMRRDGIDVTLKYRSGPVTGGPRRRATEISKRRTTRGMLADGMDESKVAHDRRMSVDDVRRIQMADEVGLDGGDVPSTWAGAFRKLAERIRERDPEAFEYAAKLAGVKGMVL